MKSDITRRCSRHCACRVSGETPSASPSASRRASPGAAQQMSATFAPDSSDYDFAGLQFELMGVSGGDPYNNGFFSTTGHFDNSFVYNPHASWAVQPGAPAALGVLRRQLGRSACGGGPAEQAPAHEHRLRERAAVVDRVVSRDDGVALVVRHGRGVRIPAGSYGGIGGGNGKGTGTLRGRVLALADAAADGGQVAGSVHGLSSLTLLHPNSPNHGHVRTSYFASTLASSDGGEPSSPTSPTISNFDSARLSVGQDHGPSTDGYQSHSRRTSITITAPSSPGSCGDADASSSGKQGEGQKSKSDTDAAEEGKKEKEREKRERQIVLGSDEPGTEADIGPFPAQLNAFALTRLVDPKSLRALEALGGVDGLLHGLGTDAHRGLSNQQSAMRAELGGGKGGRKGSGDGAPPAFFSADSGAHAMHADCQHVYGQNDKVLVLLSIAAVVSLTLGLFQDFGTQHPTFSCGSGQTCTQPPVDWNEGVAIIAAIVIVVVVGSMNDWQKEKQFKKLNEKKEDRTVKIICDGAEKVINVKKGEADSSVSSHADCFVVSGSKVLEGAGSYVVIAVGIKSFNGRIMMASGYSNLITSTMLRTDNDNTPLQMKLNNLAELIAKLRSTVGLLLFVVLLIRFFVQLSTGDPVRSVDQKGLAFVQILIISLTLAFAPAMKRMTQEKLLVRVLGGCETMVNTSVGCTDKTGMLVQNVMGVIMGSAYTNVGEEPGVRETPEEREQCRQHPGDFLIKQSGLHNVLSPALRQLFNDALAENSTAFEDEDSKTSALRCVPCRYRTRRQPTGECKQEGSGGQWWHAQGTYSSPLLFPAQAV
ncbi:hypothetical protein DFH11DRAFT_1728039 [Phellopilus nigrolimitatus]|nr:hypothetical protein DFH11DRAFT_1728039 [Phellopilus nigrolimitatus]